MPRLTPASIGHALRCGKIRILVALIPLMLATAGCTAPDQGGVERSEAGVQLATHPVEIDLSHHFAAYGAEGALVAYDGTRGEGFVHEPERARRRFLPASTFKILNSLIALETGVVADEHEIIPWDGVDRGDWWNGDQPMAVAFQRSTVWLYQELARRVGEARMREWVERAGYGNSDIGGGVDRFWLEGELRISAEEQLELLRRLHAEALPFSTRSQRIVKELMRMENGEGYVLRGKTGWARAEGVNYGWLVGWVEREGEEPFFFATQIESDRADFPMREAQQAITRGAVRELGVAVAPAP